MNQRPPGFVRIIGGRLRGSKLPVADLPGLRPSADRVRETLFNWLQSAVPGARVLDLFAGSGALGFEAASRGAAEVVMIEREPRLAESLRASAARLGQGGVAVHCGDAIRWLQGAPSGPFDIAFMDPPFDSALWQPAFQALDPWLAPAARVYVESPHDQALDVPGHWRLHREGRTRDVRYALFQAGNGPAADSADTLASEPNPQGNPSA